MLGVQTPCELIHVRSSLCELGVTEHKMSLSLRHIASTHCYHDNLIDIDEKSIEFLRKKGIAKASKKMSRTASEGLVLVKENQGEISIIEINSETDFVAKNKDFLSFCKELSDINFS